MPPKKTSGKPKKKAKGKDPMNEKNSEKKRSRRKKESYGRYIHKLLKQNHPDLGITPKAMDTMNNFMIDMFERIAGEASRLCSYNKKKTLQSHEIQTAVRLILPGELREYAMEEGKRAITEYTKSKNSNKIVME